MKIAFHGGKCCGIKTIHGFDNLPSNKVSPKRKYKLKHNDRYGHNVSSAYNFYHKERPLETYEERLDAYIAWLKQVRPAGMIEVTLTKFQVSYYKWGPALERRGFKKACQFKNSNSGNVVCVFHLIYGQE